MNYVKQTNMLYALLRIAVFSVLFMSCEKKSEPTSLIVGKWSLDEIEKQINGTVGKGKVPNNVAVVVEFGKKNEFNEKYENTIPIEYGFLGCGGGSYELEESNEIRIRAACMSSLSGHVFVISELATNRLVLFDEIGSKFSFER